MTNSVFEICRTHFFVVLRIGVDVPDAITHTHTHTHAHTRTHANTHTYTHELTFQKEGISVVPEEHSLWSKEVDCCCMTSKRLLDDILESVGVSHQETGVPEEVEGRSGSLGEVGDVRERSGS